MGWLRYHWFDLVFLVLAVSGLVYGFKRGLSIVLVPTLQWLTIAAVGGTLSEPIGAPIAALIEIQPNAAIFFVYFLLGIGVSYGFWHIKKTVARGLPGSDCFGGGEFPLGAAAGAVQFVSILFVCLALLSTQYIPEEDLAEPVYAYLQNQDEGLQPADLHRSIFVRSWSGRWLKYSFGRWLIAAQPPVKYDSVVVEGYHKGMQRAIEGERAK